MIISKNLYLDDANDKKMMRYLKLIKNKKKSDDIFVIVLPIFKDGLLEIYNYNEFFQPFYKKMFNEIILVGISLSKESAIDLAQKIISDIYSITSNFDMKEFFINR